MSNFKTIATFVFPSEMQIAKAKLESENIQCRVLDELTVQAHNFISNAIGGVKLQVEESNFERACSILSEGGLNLSTESEPTGLEKFLHKPKNRKVVGIALFSFLALVITFSLGFFLYSYFNKPTPFEKFVNGDWCLDHIVYSNEEYLPKTIKRNPGIGITYTPYFYDIRNCQEKIVFRQDGSLNLPGFNTPRLNGNWEFDGDSLTISNVDSLDFVFDYKYNIEFYNGLMILVSDYTHVVCYDIK